MRCKSRNMKSKIEAELEKLTQYGGFIDGTSFEINYGDPDYEFMQGLWDAIEKDIKDSKKINHATRSQDHKSVSHKV